MVYRPLHRKASTQGMSWPALPHAHNLLCIFNQVLSHITCLRRLILPSQQPCLSIIINELPLLTCFIVNSQSLAPILPMLSCLFRPHSFLPQAHCMLQSTLFFAWTLSWSCDAIPPSRQAASAQEPITHYIPQCYTTRPHEQATTPYEPTPCRRPPSSRGHAPSHVHRTTTRAPCPRAPCRATRPYPLEYPLPPVLLYGGVHRACDAEPGIPACGRLGQSYVRRATARARSSHALLAGQPRRPHAYLVT